MSGWPVMEVHQTQWKAAHDTYGKLFVYLRKEFARFLDHLAAIKINFQLLHLDVRYLPQHLIRNEYSRIEVGTAMRHISFDFLICNKRHPIYAT